MVLTPDEAAVNARIETEGLQHKFDTQLVVMRDDHAAKQLRVAPDLDRVFNYPDAVRWELKEQGLKVAEIAQELADQRAYYQWKQDRLTDIVSLIDTEIGFRADGKVDRSPIGTIFFIDSVNGLDSNDGLTTGAAFKTLDRFTEFGRSAGDRAVLRRGLGTDYDDGTDLVFTSDGTVDNPIIVEADYDDDFGDEVDLSATATATLTFGSKTVTFASDISGVLAAGDWIYVSGDDVREFAYEVDTVVTTTVTLFLPYKGAQGGSGKTVFNLQSPPIWNTAAGDFGVNLETDDYWKFQGIHFRGTDNNGVFRIDSSVLPLLRDCIFEANGASDFCARFTDDWVFARFDKCRFFNYQRAILGTGGIGGWIGEAYDCLFDGNSVASSRGLGVHGGMNVLFVDSEFKNHALGDIVFGSSLAATGIVRLRNCILASTTEVGVHELSLHGLVLSEDHDGILGDTRQLTYLSTAEGTPIIQSETTIVRPGGGTISIKVTPSIGLSALSEHARQKLFEYGFFATTAAKTYDVFFRPNATGDWTADPTNTELWIEAEYWDHATNNLRRIVKSTGVIDMNGSTAWQKLSVTITPGQEGVLYLRGYYAKTKEGGVSNVFFCDTKVEVT